MNEGSDLLSMICILRYHKSINFYIFSIEFHTVFSEIQDISICNCICCYTCSNEKQELLFAKLFNYTTVTLCHKYVRLMISYACLNFIAISLLAEQKIV